VASQSRFSSRRPDAASGIPRGDVLATFELYPDAQALVTRLVDSGVPPVSLSIVGSDVTVVERVTGAMGYPRAALSSAISGSWLGVLAGLVYVIFSPDDVVTPILAGILIGAGVGMVIGILLFTFGRAGQRNYRSIQQVIATSYRVMVSSEAHSQAVAAMAASSPGEEG
jgi:hypothetical protein